MLTLPCPHCQQPITIPMPLAFIRFRCDCGKRYTLVWRDGEWRAAAVELEQETAKDTGTGWFYR